MIKVGIIGCGFVGDLHAAAFRMVPGAEVVAVAARSPGKAEHFAKERGIPHAFQDYRQPLALKDINLVTLAIPMRAAGLGTRKIAGPSRVASMTAARSTAPAASPAPISFGAAPS